MPQPVALCSMTLQHLYLCIEPNMIYNNLHQSSTSGIAALPAAITCFIAPRYRIYFAWKYRTHHG